MGNSEFVQITGLLGTYEDCVSWLSGTDNLGGITSVSILWMGNSIANVHYSEASTFLSKFRKACSQSSLRCQFLVSVDVCQQAEKVSEAYSLELPELEGFMSNGMWSANSNVGQDIFLPEDWFCVSKFCPVAQSLSFFFTAKRDIEVADVDGSNLYFQKGEMVEIITSGKWTEVTMKRISRQAGFSIQRRWKDKCDAYGMLHCHLQFSGLNLQSFMN